MNNTAQPLVSCIMPTYNRRRFVPQAIQYFLRQEYEHKELIVIDDGNDVIKDLIPDIPSIKYYRLDHKISLGAKLNLACKYAMGNIIIHWDDDDWYAPRRLAYQVNTLLTEGKDLCGINQLLYYDIRNGSAYQYVYPQNQRVWLLGSSLCYTRELWNKHQFADINVGMDGLFVWAAPPDRVKVLADSSFAVHMIHDNNISPKKTDSKWWHNYPVEEIRKIINGDWRLYHETELSNSNCAKISEDTVISYDAMTSTKVIKNVYACLVHENEDCIIDLIRNLHYHDPESFILLYNGSENTNLFKTQFLYKKPWIVIHPRPFPVKYGYLHQFALACMEYALENLEFHFLTIVDSDQLAIRSGYSEYLGKFSSARSNIGLLSSNPERVNKDNLVNRVAMQAFKEYDLWKPLLNVFDKGEDNFVHWTFWPSTVIARDAVKDLVKLFKENKQLQEIMKSTKIWASEEVIFPTLVKLLGYEIVANPCSYEFVQYKSKFTIEDINNAFSKTNVYWIHPIERLYDSTLRNYVREKSHNYSEKMCKSNANTPDELSFISALITKIKKIEGWLSDREAQLLISVTKKACIELIYPHNIVEIGSYHGKSTVLFGSIVKKYFPEVRIYAIDPHDGKLGASDQGLQLFPPSLEKFKKNIENAGLCDNIEIINNNTYNVNWEKPVSLLFVDGLHDYPNVLRDFCHFSNWIVPGGYVAFHDYAVYFPGVMKFVNELLSTGLYEKIDIVESLIILRKF